jgi:hypothetical protein
MTLLIGWMLLITVFILIILKLVKEIWDELMDKTWKGI